MRRVIRQITITLTFVVFGFVLLNLPGQNTLQVLTLHPQAVANQELYLNLTPADLPTKIPGSPEPPSVSAKAATIIDVSSGSILFEKNPNQQFMPASTTKIMTALVALDEYNLDEVVVIKDENLSIGSRSDLVAGEHITVKNAIKALLISSGNDAALALAQHHPLGYNHFVSLMNQKAQSLNLHNSHFSNVSGVEQFDHYVSAHDLALLSKEALGNDFFKQIVAIKQETIASVDGQVVHQLTNTNELLGEVEGVSGIKTGWTMLAGECLVTYIVRDNREIIVVVLDSTDRFGESKALINWTYDNFTWQPFPLDLTQPLPVPKPGQSLAQ